MEDIAQKVYIYIKRRERNGIWKVDENNLVIPYELYALGEHRQHEIVLFN